MRRLLTSLLAVSALAVAGCGGGDSGSALDSALSHLPADAPFAIAIETDVEGDQYRQLSELIRRFPFGGQLEQQLQSQLEASGASYEDDVRPLLGNPVVIGIPDVRSFTSDSGGETGFVAAVQVEDEDTLNRLVEEDGQLRERGEAAGATLYEGEGQLLAIEGDMVVIAENRELLVAALERADGDEGLDEETFEEGLEGLPESPLARIYANVEALLEADQETADARKVKWVAALRTLGATARATDRGLEIDFRLRTEGELTEADLPIAPGNEAPGVIEREGEIGLGIRDLAHIVRFAENAGQAVDPAGFGDYAQAKQTIDSQLDVNLDEDLIGQLTGDVSASLAVDGGFGVLAELEDPQEFERTLERVADVLPSFAEGAGFGTVALAKPGAGEDFYALAQPDGDSVVFGVVNEKLVVANDPARAGELAATEPAAVDGAEGSAVTSADAGELVAPLLEQLGPALGLDGLGGLGTFGGVLVEPLGDLNGSLSASPEELRGKLTLAIE